jgi:hypothetical protein
MQIVAIMAMRARFSCLAAHDAKLPAHDARHATAPNDSVERDKPCLAYDTMQYAKTKLT